MNYYTVETIIQSINYDCCNCKMSLAPSIQVKAILPNRPVKYPSYLCYCLVCFNKLLEQANVYVLRRHHLEIIKDPYASYKLVFPNT